MLFQDEATLGSSVSILVNGTGSITGNVTVAGGRLVYTSMDNVSSVLQNLTLTSGLIDFSGFEEFMDIVGSDALIGKTYDLGSIWATALSWMGCPPMRTPLIIRAVNP